MKPFKDLKYLVLGAAIAAYATHGEAAEILVWSAGAAKAPLSEVIESYQKASGNSIKVDYAPVGVLVKRLSEGGKPDVLIVSQDVIADVERNGWSVSGSSASVGSVGVGIAVKEGNPVPDISSPEALRKTLLAAKTITYMDPNKGSLVDKSFILGMVDNQTQHYQKFISEAYSKIKQRKNLEDLFLD